MNRWLWLAFFLMAAIVGAAAILRPRHADQTPQSVANSSIPAEPPGIGCRGLIEPEDGVLRVAAPYLNGRPSLISELRAKEGDWIRNGQILAVLDGWQSLQKGVLQSEADVEVARKRLALVKAGTKTADIDAQRMEVSRWESEYEIAQSEYQRSERLRENNIISNSDLDQKRLVLDRNKRTLDATRERLKSLEDIRAEDVDVRSAELSAAMAQVDRARAELERMIVRSPAGGRVLKIHAHPGEEVGPQGILELGKTDRMYVIAEVYESDIGRVRVGQKATVSGDLLPEKITGTVTEISGQVTKSELLPLDPAAFADTRVMKVKIQLQNSERAAGLIYGKVNVVIYP